MSHYAPRLRVYVSTGSCQKFREKFFEARDTAADTFEHDGITFKMGDRGSVFFEQGVYDKLPRVIEKDTLRVRRCAITATYSTTKTPVQPGSYGGRRDLVGVHASVAQTGEGAIEIEVSGASLANVIAFFDRLVAGSIRRNA